MLVIRKLLLAALISSPLVGLPQAAFAGLDLVIRVAPPAPRVEVVPAPRRGFVWVPGYWNWNGRQHVWVAGNWQKERRGYVYAEPRWVERNGAWVLERPGWRKHDRDGDGIPNGADRHPNNPKRP
jgi:hypothetical protein